MNYSIVILIADDDPDDRELFITCVQEISSDIKCVEAEDGEKALNILKSDTPPPDIIFLDLNMPRINGQDCLKEIKKIRKLKHIPIVVYTTSRIDDSLRKLGADHFITKPTSFNGVCGAVNEVLMKFGVKSNYQG